MNYPFWSTENYAINTKKLTGHLSQLGFGLYRTSSIRSSNCTLFRNVKNVLQVHDAISAKRVLTEEISMDEELKDSDKDKILDKIIRTSASTFQTYLNHLPTWSTEGYPGTEKLKLFMDNSTSCFIPFLNGVVVIDRNQIELKPYEILKDECIWESARINHNINLYPSNEFPSDLPQVFRNFIHFALKTDIVPQLDDLINRFDDGTSSVRYQESKSAFETAYGYLIHDYNPPDEMKMVVFTDLESSAVRAQGRNGKSLSMGTLEHYKKSSFVDGKMFRKSLNDSARFNFSSVTVDTRLVVINDLNPDLDLTQLFSQITDDFTIEGKGTNKIVIPRSKKPKMCCNTNYVLSGSGASYEGRQHIVEFGNYFNRCETKGIKPKEVIGKLIGGESFNQVDWDAFYSYGFSCVQRYLREGLFKASNNNYKRKSLVQLVEGENGSGDIVSWLENWCQTRRLAENYHDDGISELDLYNQFLTDNPELEQSWKSSKFLTAVFDFATNADGYDYNPHKASEGNTKSKRKWRQGPKGKQSYFVRITHKDDQKVSS
jgi:hypothetical protein